MQQIYTDFLFNFIVEIYCISVPIFFNENTVFLLLQQLKHLKFVPYYWYYLA